MDPITFEELLDRNGADFERWAPADRAAARSLLATSSAARAMLTTMVEVEAVLRGRDGDDVGARDAMAARAMQHPQETPARRLAVRAVWAAAAAAVLILGMSIGDLAAQHSDEPDRLMATAFEAGGVVDVD